MRFVHVVGVRPNFMKIAPIMSALGRHMDVEQLLVHTGQHYDARMSQVFFDDLDIPRPDVNLGLGSAQHESQTGTMMVALDVRARRGGPTLVRPVHAGGDQSPRH